MLALIKKIAQYLVHLFFFVPSVSNIDKGRQEEIYYFP